MLIERGVRLELSEHPGLAAAALHQLALPVGGAERLGPGDALELRLVVRFRGPLNAPVEETLVLAVRIVAEPVVPPPQAAYALLRRQVLAQREQVECTRFAWGPAAGRIDLLCADGLRSGVVRRRAVFRWTGSARPGTVRGYAVQKPPAGRPTCRPWSASKRYSLALRQGRGGHKHTAKAQRTQRSYEVSASSAPLRCFHTTSTNNCHFGIILSL